MQFCPQCGAQVDDNVSTCPQCGAPMVAQQAQPQQQVPPQPQYQQPQQQVPPQPQQQVPPQPQYQQSQQQVPPQPQYQQPQQQVPPQPQQAYAEGFDYNDIQANKTLSVFAYIGILWLIPLLAAKDSKFARFHANQGLILFIVEAGISVVSGVLSWVPFIGWAIGLSCFALWIACIVFAIMGIVAAGQGQVKELPIIGKFKLIK